MTSKAVIFALAGTVLLVSSPYVVAMFGIGPNRTETLLLVAALWAACWTASRMTSRRRAGR